jgi:hypothetical protein
MSTLTQINTTKTWYLICNIDHASKEFLLHVERDFTGTFSLDGYIEGSKKHKGRMKPFVPGEHPHTTRYRWVYDRGAVAKTLEQMVLAHIPVLSHGDLSEDGKVAKMQIKPQRQMIARALENMGYTKIPVTKKQRIAKLQTELFGNWAGLDMNTGKVSLPAGSELTDEQREYAVQWINDRDTKTSIRE